MIAFNDVELTDIETTVCKSRSFVQSVQILMNVRISLQPSLPELLDRVFQNSV